jgi:hypothetical protein
MSIQVGMFPIFLNFFVAYEEIEKYNSSCLQEEKKDQKHSIKQQ